MMHITLKDVARRAGVSAKTVSRVLNGEAHVRKEKQQAVERAIATLGDVEYGILRYVAHEAHTARAQDAAIGDVENVTAKVFGWSEALGFAQSRFGASFRESVVLQFTLSRLIADRAIQRMIDQQKLQYPLACLKGLG